MLLTHASQHLSFPTARYFSTAAHPRALSLARRPRVRERAWRHAWGRWPAADVGRRARARPAWHDDVEGLLCFWWCACRRTTEVSRPLSRRRDRAAAANEEPTRKPVAFPVRRSSYTVQRTVDPPAGPPVLTRSGDRKGESGVVLLGAYVVCADRTGGTRWRSADTPVRRSVPESTLS